MVYLAVIIIAQVINIGVEKNFHKRKKKIKDQPYVHHLDIGGLWKIVGNVDKHGRKDQHAGEVDCDHGFEEKWFKEVCAVADQIQEDGRKIYIQ